MIISFGKKTWRRIACTSVLLYKPYKNSFINRFFLFNKLDDSKLEKLKPGSLLNGFTT